MAKMIKKLLVLAVLGIFVLSLLPGALAGKNLTEKANQAEKTNLKPLADRMEKAGEQVQERTQVAKEKFVQAQEKFREAREKYQEKRSEFLEKKQKLPELRENARCDEQTEDCRQKKNLLKEGVRQHLVKTIELIERSLEKLTNRVEVSQIMTEKEKEEAQAKLSQLEQKLAEKKAEIEAMAGELSGEELKAKIRELKSLWQETRKEQRQIITGLISHRQETIVGVYTKFGERLETQINSLAGQGADVSELNEKLAEYQDKVKELEEVEAGNFKEFHVVSREAKSILRELLVGIREMKGEIEAGGQEEVEAEETDREEGTEELEETGE